MDCVVYCGNPDNSLETLSAKHLDLLFSYKNGVRQKSGNFSPDKCSVMIASYHLFYDHILVGNTKQIGQCQVFLSSSLLTSMFDLSDKRPQETETAVLLKHGHIFSSCRIFNPPLFK